LARILVVARHFGLVPAGGQQPRIRAMKQAFLALLLGGYHWVLRFYPAAFRSEFGDEMETVLRN